MRARPANDHVGSNIAESVDVGTLRGASELCPADDEPREPGCETRLGQTDGPLESLFELSAGAPVLLKEGAVDRCLQFSIRCGAPHRADGDSAGLPAPTSLYLAPEVADRGLNRGPTVGTGRGASGAEIFALQRSPGRALKSFVED